jgi:hypothetical protein
LCCGKCCSAHYCRYVMCHTYARHSRQADQKSVQISGLHTQQAMPGKRLERAQPQGRLLRGVTTVMCRAGCTSPWWRLRTTFIQMSVMQLSDKKTERAECRHTKAVSTSWRGR